MCSSITLALQLYAQFFSNLLCDAAVGKLQFTFPERYVLSRILPIGDTRRNDQAGMKEEWKVIPNPAFLIVLYLSESLQQQQLAPAPSGLLSLWGLLEVSAVATGHPLLRSEHQLHEILSSLPLFPQPSISQFLVIVLIIWVTSIFLSVCF